MKSGPMRIAWELRDTFQGIACVMCRYAWMLKGSFIAGAHRSSWQDLETWFLHFFDLIADRYLINQNPQNSNRLLASLLCAHAISSLNQGAGELLPPEDRSLEVAEAKSATPNLHKKSGMKIKKKRKNTRKVYSLVAECSFFFYSDLHCT